MTATATAGSGGSSSCASDDPGPIRLRCRATDLAGRTQPEEPEWNRFGYGNNAIHQVEVQVV